MKVLIQQLNLKTISNWLTIQTVLLKFYALLQKIEIFFLFGLERSPVDYQGP
jgi:hypothetical protein